MKRLILASWLLGFLASASFANLHDPANSADYLIITPQYLIDGYPWIQQLADWRTQHGRLAKVVATDSIWEEFGDGTSSDVILKTFLWYAYRQWRPPQVKEVFLIGFHDVIPSHTVDNSGEPFLTDLYYATDPDCTNWIPHFSIGRLPWSPQHSELLYNYYQKVVAYETAPETDWQWRVQMVADTDRLDSMFSFMSEEQITHMHTGYIPLRNYADYSFDHPWHGDSISVHANWQAGNFLVSYTGHQPFGVWGWHTMLDSAGASTLTNSPRLPIALGMILDLSSTDFRLSAVPKVLLSNPDGGAIAYIAQTGFAYASTANNFRDIQLDLATSDSVRTAGDLWRRTIETAVDQWILLNQCEESMLLGDPGLRLPAIPHNEVHTPPELPSQIKLVGNYPNPFNPTTQIQFELSHNTHVKLDVRNLLGQHVTTLVDETENAGVHTVMWNAGIHPSGIYFAVLQTGNLTQVKKMMLLK